MSRYIVKSISWNRACFIYFYDFNMYELEDELHNYYTFDRHYDAVDIMDVCMSPKSVQSLHFLFFL